MMTDLSIQTPFVEVALPLPLRQLFTYRVPEGWELQVGTRVLVPFGPRRMTGYVVGAAEAAPEGFTIRKVSDILDDEPLFSPADLVLYRWMATYYHESLGEVIRTALPGGLQHNDLRVISRTEAGHQAFKEGRLPEKESALLTTLGEGVLTVAFLTRQCKASFSQLLSLQKRGLVDIRYELRKGSARKRLEKVAVYLGDPTVTSLTAKDGRVLSAIEKASSVAVRELNQEFKSVRDNLKRLVSAGAVRVEERRVFRDVLGRQAIFAADRAAPPSLTPEQVPIVARLVEAVEQKSGRFLLHGVTGSGKTEVYLRAIDAVLERGGQAIVLVPEIALTPQLVSRFQSRFGDAIAVLHSALSAGERLDQWSEIAKGRRSVVIGARSAIFAPVRNLGLIVVDEEHEASFKQEDRPRYNARDLALVRGARSGCPVVLGSATPSLETLVNARSGRYELLEMRSRVLNRPLPRVELVDLRTGRAPGKHELISPRLAQALRETIQKGEQAILFLNRRGFSPFLLCESCGEIPSCSACSISLSYSRRIERVRCHYCGFAAPRPSTCAECHSDSLSPVGAGTERVQQEVQALLGEEVRVARMDRDTAQGKQLLEILRAFRERETQVLIGTQMVAKGHDFPGVTLVGVLMADQGLRFPDFRAVERTFQLLTQVAGRAGRGELPGQVLIQSFKPDHFALLSTRDHDFSGFAETEISYRKAFGYPPFAFCALVKVTHEDANTALRRAEEVAQLVRDHARECGVEESVLVLGPTYAPIQRIKGKTRLQVFLKSSTRDLLHRALDDLDRFVDGEGLASIVALDVDPISLL